MKINEDKFNIMDFEKSKNKKWALGNSILYKMCSDYPRHDDIEQIRAKIWLIGRSYAAAIERRNKKIHINDDFYDYVCNQFIKFNKDNNFDSKLEYIKNKDFNESNIKEFTSLHKELTKFFSKLTGKEKRSLASKYLHFHSPNFPIYDSRARESINQIVSGKTLDIGGDKQYSSFCQKILFLYLVIKEKTGRIPTLREIDTYLVYLANTKLIKKIK
jgi:hypothetical protein